MGARLRIAVVSPFLDKRHGTERCLAEQVERLARDHGYEVHLYSQRIEDIPGAVEFRQDHARKQKREQDANRFADGDAPAAAGLVVWHRVSDIPGPHLFRYLWWLLANHVRRWEDGRSSGLRYNLVYSPGINCFDADVILVHVVFQELYRHIRNELRLPNNPPRTWPRLFHRWLYYRLLMALERRIYSNWRATLAAVSSLTASEVQRLFGRKDVMVIPNAVDLEVFNPADRKRRRPESRQRLGIQAGDFVVLLIGNNWKTKGLTCLLEAMAKIRDLPVRLLVVGRDDPRPCEAWLERLRMRTRVTFSEPSPDVLQFYAAADVYAGPSLHDSFALPPAEAMACGLPVITSVNNGGSEMITDGVDGFVLVDPQDSDAMAEKIQLLYANPDLARRMAENAAAVARRYRWEHNVEQVKMLLEQAAGRKATRKSAIGEDDTGAKEFGAKLATDGNRFLTERQKQPALFGAARTEIMADLRVLVLAPSLERSGGVQRYTITLVKALRQVLPSQNVRLVALSPEGGGHARLRFAAKARFVRSAVRATMGWRPGLVICTHVSLAALGWVLGVLRRCPYWVVAYGIEVWGALSFAKRFGLQQADRVLSLSLFTRDQVLRRHSCSARKLSVLYCAFADDLLSVTPDHGLLARLGLKQGRVILTVGRLAARERYKGHDVVLQALQRIAEKCPEAKYLIVGDGDDRPRLERLAGALGVNERVLFAGEIMDDAGLAACYQACEVFVLPAKTRIADKGAQGEGFGIAFLEAMAFGKPVVGPNVGAPAEFIRHSQHGLLVDPESPEEVAQAVLTLLSNPELASRMGEQGRVSVLEEFSMRAMVQQVGRLLQECRP